MATEGDLKKVELKVSVICCDGCKRKVKKALHSIEGVLKIEIDPLQPKVSIFGNVDPQILIKKLHKAGKQAQLWSQSNTNQINSSSPKDQKKVIIDDQITVVQPLMSISKPSSSIVKQEESSDKSKHCHSNGDHQHMNNKLANVLQTQQLHYWCYCMVEPCYALAVPTLMAAPPGHRPPPSCCHDHHHRPPVQVPPPSEATSQVGDFFSEDNTMGCYLM